MQLTLGRRWVLELQFTMALRERAEGACDSVRASMQQTDRAREMERKWERDKIAATMLSSWDLMNRRAEL